MKKLQKPDKTNNKSTDEATDSNDEETREAFSAYIPKQQANDIFRSNDSKAISTIWVLAKKNDTWCYDTGASIHVTNNRDLLSNYRPVVSSVIVGNTETTILGYGELKVRLTKSLNRTLFPLKYVVYYLGFYINLISTERATNIGIYLNSKDYMLEEKDRTPIYKLNTRLGIYLVK